MRPLPSSRLGLTIVSLAFVACGGAASEPKSPPAQKEMTATEADGPSSVAEAQDQIARAKRELEHAAVSSQEAKTSDSSAPPAPPPDTKAPKKTTTPTPVSPSTPPRSEMKPHDGVASKHEDTCGNPCKAITSMRRAVTALCRMTGEEDGRCVDAKRTLASSEARVASCPCAKG